MRKRLVVALLLTHLGVAAMIGAQPGDELLDFRGMVSFVDVDSGQIGVRGEVGNEAIFDVTDETEIVYTDPETEETEVLELSDLESGLTVLVKYSLSEESALAWLIEIDSWELGHAQKKNAKKSWYLPLES